MREPPRHRRSPRQGLTNVSLRALGIGNSIYFTTDDGMLYHLTAEGTGKALSPTGLGKPLPPAGEKQVPTRRIWIIVPLDSDSGTLEILFHCPESAYDKLGPDWEAPFWEAMVKSLGLD